MSNGDDIYYLRRARDLSAASDDPSTKVGVILTTATSHKKIIYGINSLPVGINRVLATLPREDKLKLIIHAEMDAICTAARFGDSLIGSTLYMVCKDVQRHGQYWGSAPCLSCAKHVIASGVRRVVTIDTSPNLAAVQMASISACAPPSRWVPEVLAGQAMLEEAGVLYEEVPYGSLTL